MISKQFGYFFGNIKYGSDIGESIACFEGMVSIFILMELHKMLSA